MEINDLIQQHQTGRDGQQRAIFASLFIMENRLQTIFDKTDPTVTIKQFMLLTMVRFTVDQETTLSHLGKLLGCSRQNIKKLAVSLEKEELVEIQLSPSDKRKTIVGLTEKGRAYFRQVASIHTSALTSLFQDYSDNELESFFGILMKLYNGIDRLEQE